MQRPKVAIVGSRKITLYGKQVTAQLTRDLARAGVVIVSGLAIGIDSIAHRAALEAGGLTIAVLPAGLDQIYPTRHHQLAEQILQGGGALMSEYPPGSTPYKGNFIERNRLVSGLANAILITEASLKSGTLHTARFALEQGRDVLAVPGNITSSNATGTNNLIKSGAVPVTSVNDIFHCLGITAGHARQKPRGDTPEQQVVLDLLLEGTSDGSELLNRSKLGVTEFTQTITMLEITGNIKAAGGNQWLIA